MPYRTVLEKTYRFVKIYIFARRSTFATVLFGTMPILDQDKDEAPETFAPQSADQPFAL